MHKSNLDSAPIRFSLSNIKVNVMLPSKNQTEDLLVACIDIVSSLNSYSLFSIFLITTSQVNKPYTLTPLFLANPIYSHVCHLQHPNSL